MAKKRSSRKKKFTIRFELGLGGLVGLFTICFCIFLWMFLLGVWAGQTVLLPSGRDDTSKAISRFSAKIWSQARKAAPSAQPDPDASADGPRLAPQGESDEEPSYFSLQVAAYADEENARQEVLDWQARGEEAFFRRPREGSSLYRVFVGRYDTLAAANDKVDELEEADSLQAFITLLPVGDGQ
ncbi:MAG: hypothetical protein C0613_03300 [Desulfobulbaceae bacterium]|nr:MAG: hypothetical protein C0613_03300 [Desulfobulbaceae bacterium]